VHLDSKAQRKNLHKGDYYEKEYVSIDRIEEREAIHATLQEGEKKVVPVLRI